VKVQVLSSALFSKKLCNHYGCRVFNHFLGLTYLKWKMEEGRGKKDEGRWKMEDGRWKMEDGRWKMDFSPISH
jgi:hypothetical protein